MGRTRAKLTLLLVLALSAAACGGGNSGDGNGTGTSGGELEGELKIGVINPFSGPNAPGGEAIFQGYAIAAEEANADGGVLGKKVVLVRGDASAPEQGISEVNRLATSENVDLFAGTYLSGISNTASETALRYGKVYWDTNATAGNLTERGLENFFRSGPMADQFAQVAGEAVRELIPENVGKDIADLKVCVTHEESIYGTTISERVVDSLKEAGAEVTANIAYPASAPDLGNVILRCQGTSPDVWVQTGYVADGNLLLRTANQQNWKPKARLLIGTGDTRLNLDAVGKDILEGVFVVGYPHFDIEQSYAPGSQEFLKTYKDEHGSAPTFPQTMTAYAGMKMLFDALEEAGSTEPGDVEKVVTAWDKPLGSYATGYGAKFDENHQNVMALPLVVQWQDGKVVTVYPDEAALEGSEVIEPAA
jgi:branched-chain amino acid transport system substrate-binding protein